MLLSFSLMLFIHFPESEFVILPVSISVTPALSLCSLHNSQPVSSSKRKAELDAVC